MILSRSWVREMVNKHKENVENILKSVPNDTAKCLSQMFRKHSGNDWMEDWRVNTRDGEEWGADELRN